MWDRSNSQTFTKTEATAFIGSTIKTNGGPLTIKDSFCDGPGSYLLVDDRGLFVYKRHNNCLYVLPGVVVLEDGRVLTI